MISPEHALEHMPVEKAWTLLNTLSSQVVGKQTELQVSGGKGVFVNAPKLWE